MAKNGSGSSDPVLSVLGAVVDAAVAPVVGACEIVSDGKVSDSTADSLCKGLAGDVVSDALTKD